MTLGHRLEWLALKAALALLRRGDMAAAARRVRGLAPSLRPILRSEWAWANTNLAQVFGPALPPPQRERLAGLAFANILVSHVEGLRAGDVTLRDEGMEPLRAALALGRGVVGCSIHLGCWEPGLMHLAARGIPLAVVYRHANNPLSEQEFMAARAAYGVEWIRRDNPRATLKALGNGKMVGLMVDINIREGGVTAPFLGLPAQCPPGPARLAMAHRAPVVPAVAVREGDGRARLWLGEPLEPPARGGGDAALAAFTARINALFTPWILEYAEQYNWLHARWRSRPDGRLWTPRTPLEEMWQERSEPHPPLSARVAALLTPSPLAE